MYRKIHIIFLIDKRIELAKRVPLSTDIDIFEEKKSIYFSKGVKKVEIFLQLIMQNLLKNQISN